MKTYAHGLDPIAALRFSFRIPLPALVFFSVLLMIISACAPQKQMSLEEARQVTVSMAGKSFVPPPRRVDDVLVLLDQPSKYDRHTIAELYAQADAIPPDSTNSGELAKFYRERGQAARELGRYRQSLDDLRKSNGYREDAWTLMFLSTAEALSGNFQNAITYVKRSNQLKKRPSCYFLLALYYSWIGDLVACEKTAEEGIRYINTVSPKAKGMNLDWLSINKHRIQATLFHAKGQFSAAEPYRRGAVNILQKYIKKYPLVYLHNKGRLDMNLAHQGRLVEAELGARETLNETIGLTGRMSGTTADSIINLGKILLMQGRLADAEKLFRSGIHIFEMADMPKDATWVGEAKGNLVKILVAKNDYQEAARLLSDIKTDMASNRYDYEKYIARDPNMMIALLMTGRQAEALDLIHPALKTLHTYLGESHYQTAEMLGLRGMAHKASGKQDQAIADFSKAVPVILKDRGQDSDYLKNHRLKVITEAYIDLLADIHTHKTDKHYHLHASAEIFRLCESINGSLVKRALGANGARAAAVDDELADLVRREQDAYKQIESLKRTLSNALSAQSDQMSLEAIVDLKSGIDSLSRARTAILTEIKRRFPKYDELIHPQAPTFATLRSHLQIGEALIVIYPTHDKTFIWSIPHEGLVAFAIANWGRDDLKIKANRLRQTLAPIPGTFGEIPAFDLATAHQIYSRLLQPVASGWQHADDLIIVATGPLGQIPLAVLTTEPVELGKEKSLLFDNYRQIPWLIKRCSVTRLPSVSSLVTLRSLPKGNGHRQAFLGFGDPYFNLEQMAQGQSGKPGNSQTAVHRGGPQVRVRSIRVTGTESLDSDQMLSSQIGMLSRLPDTAEEIRSIGAALDADPARDIFLGERATEFQVKRMSLSDRKIIAFATHGLVPGDLDGLEQPALAMCSPAVSRDGEDGLLTMGEILKLRLNADWVVLSACNTGAADGAGAEAVSGLGRAFFYAGSRALLVSMWPVESSSAMKLTTGLFQYQKEDAALSRARALQASMLDLMENQTIKDLYSGKTVASYAHPFFWAPFIVVGDGS